MSSERSAEIIEPSSHREWLRAADLQPWAHNGRYVESHARKIADNLDPDAYGIIAINRDTKTGSLTIADGHHRVRAVVDILGWTDCVVECDVFEDLTEAQMAHIFILRNPPRRKTPLTMFVNAVIEGEKDALAIGEILAHWDLVVTDSSGCRGVSCPVALRKVYCNPGCYAHRGEALRATIGLIIDTWGSDAPLSSNLIVGVGNFLARHGKQIEVARLSKILASRYGGPEGVVGQARALREAKRNNTSVADCVAQVLVDTHNTGLSAKNRLPSWS